MPKSFQPRTIKPLPATGGVADGVAEGEVAVGLGVTVVCAVAEDVAVGVNVASAVDEDLEVGLMVAVGLAPWVGCDVEEGVGLASTSVGIGVAGLGVVLAATLEMMGR